MAVASTPSPVTSAPEPSLDSLARANKALQFYVFKGGRSEHSEAEIVVARAIDEAVKEARK